MRRRSGPFMRPTGRRLYHTATRRTRDIRSRRCCVLIVTQGFGGLYPEAVSATGKFDTLHLDEMIEGLLDESSRLCRVAIKYGM